MSLPVIKNEHYMTIHSHNVTMILRHKESTIPPIVKIH
jgi:hypothetical protein